jgi:hypothetical protein
MNKATLAKDERKKMAEIEHEMLRRFQKIKPATPPAVCEHVVEELNPGRKKLFLRRCFERTFWYIIHIAQKAYSSDEARGILNRTWLVHGSCFLGSLDGAHAWVELPGGIVFDGVYQRFCDRRSYYRTQHAAAFQKYRPAAAFAIMAHLIRNDPNVYDPACEREDPMSLVALHSRHAEGFTYDWWRRFGFEMNPKRPMKVDEKAAALLIDARLHRLHDNEMQRRRSP